MPVETLQSIAAEVRRCQKCDLHLTRTNAVPGEGNPDAEIMFIGEGPGFNEDQQGRPFIGAGGQLLSQMLGIIGIEREDVFITNVVRSRPPGNRDPLPLELAACDDYTVRQIAVIKPLLIVTLGRFSMARFFGPKQRITQIHGQTVVWEGITCLAMFHPAAVLRNGPPAQRAYAEDFRLIPLLLESLRAPRPTTAPPPPTEEPPIALDQMRLF